MTLNAKPFQPLPCQRSTSVGACISPLNGFQSRRCLYLQTTTDPIRICQPEFTGNINRIIKSLHETILLTDILYPLLGSIETRTIRFKPETNMKPQCIAGLRDFYTSALCIQSPPPGGWNPIFRRGGSGGTINSLIASNTTLN